MKCPVDNETLVMTERSGVEIDYCPKCRGVWLDRGELDKIIDRVAPASAAASPGQPAQRVDTSRPEYNRQQTSEHGYRQDYGHKPYKKKREGFLGELFDF